MKITSHVVNGYGSSQNDNDAMNYAAGCCCSCSCCYSCASTIK
ncbi:listeriolysin S family TOMM bacteriocin [Listeria aquatica]